MRGPQAFGSVPTPVAHGCPGGAHDRRDRLLLRADAPAADAVNDPVPASLRLPATASSVRQARTFIRTEVARLGGDDPAQELAALLVSELVTNAVLHARTESQVSISTTAEGPPGFVIMIADGSPARLRQRRYGVQESTGRGLRLVETLSAAWGIEPSPVIAAAGKAVWFRLPAHVQDIDGDREADLIRELFAVDAFEDSA